MRFLDARTGHDVVIGEVYDGWRVVQLRDRFLSASVLIEYVGGDPRVAQPGARVWQPVHVRFLHPQFMFQRTLFLPT